MSRVYYHVKSNSILSSLLCALSVLPVWQQTIDCYNLRLSFSADFAQHVFLVLISLPMLMRILHRTVSKILAKSRSITAPDSCWTTRPDILSEEKITLTWRVLFLWSWSWLFLPILFPYKCIYSSVFSEILVGCFVCNFPSPCFIVLWFHITPMSLCPSASPSLFFIFLFPNHFSLLYLFFPSSFVKPYPK